MSLGHDTMAGTWLFGNGWVLWPCWSGFNPLTVPKKPSVAPFATMQGM